MCLLSLLAAFTAARAAPAIASEATQALSAQVVALGDHRHRPYAIVDKRAATLAVYRGDGTLAGLTPVLLGRRKGDASRPGVGQRTRTGTLRDDDLTTPAGRFASEPGRNLEGEAIVWIDYDAAFAIHRLRRGASYAERARRLASADLEGRRASAGCVVVPEAFFDGVVQPLLGRSRGTVYVMPEAAGVSEAMLAPD